MTAESPIRVVLCDDHRSFTDAMAPLLDLEADIDVVGAAASLAEVCDLAPAAAAHVVLMDYELPDGTGTRATEELLAREPNIKVVMLTSFADDSVLAEAVRSGVSGFVTKHAGAASVAEAIRTVAAGEAAIAPELLARLLPRLRPGDVNGVTVNERERQLLEALAEGASNRDIAARLHLSPHTVRNQLSRLYVRLGARSRLEAVAIAVREGLITGR